MQIAIVFLNGSDYWKKKVQDAALKVQGIFSDEGFLQAVAAHAGFDFTADSPAAVASRLMNAGTVSIHVGFYSKCLTRAIAYEQAGAVYFNTRKEAQGAASWQNVAHEVLHALGYSHNGNAPAGQGNTVPYAIPALAEAWLARQLVDAAQ